MVNGVIEEQDFCRLDEHGSQRQQVVLHHDVHARCQHFRQHFNHWANRHKGEHSQQHADNTGREVVHQHLKTAFDFTVNPAVKAFNCPAAERAGNHGAHKHWHIGTDDNAHGGDSADYATALAANQATTGVADEQRQQIGDHRANQLG